MQAQQIAFDDVILAEKHAKYQHLAQELDRRCKSVAYSLGRSKTAIVLEVSTPYVNELLNSNNENAQKPWQVKFIPAIALENPEKFKEEVINFLCDICGYSHPEKRRDMTPEEELQALKRKIHDHGLERVFDL